MSTARPASGVIAVIRSWRERRAWCVAIGVVLVAAWVAWATLAWQSQPRVVGLAHLDADLAAGRVTSYAVVAEVHLEDAWPAGRSPRFGPAGTTWPAQPQNHRVVWVVDSALAPVRTLDPARSLDDADTGPGAAARPDARAVGRLVAERVRPVDAGTLNDAAGRADGLAILLGVSAFLLVVVGPSPTRGTRWCWFWVCWMSLGVGVVGYAVAELLRPRAVSDADRPPGRAAGGVGVGLAMVGSALVSLALAGLEDLLGPLVVPRRLGQA
ncbi:MAG: hypothetical protein ACRCYX_09965 [Dermatophilaceae bacterium]